MGNVSLMPNIHEPLSLKPTIDQDTMSDTLTFAVPTDPGMPRGMNPSIRLFAPPTRLRYNPHCP
jgi:hypothetical protein